MSLAFSYYPQKRSILHSNMNAILKHSLMNMVFRSCYVVTFNMKKKNYSYYFYFCSICISESSYSSFLTEAKGITAKRTVAGESIN